MLEAVLGVIGALVVGSIGGRRLARRWRSAYVDRRDAAARGDAFDVPSCLRILDRRGLGRRWRQGYLYHVDGRLRFRPLPPRAAKKFDLTGLIETGTRPATRGEKAWFAGPTVVLANGPAGAVELGFGNDDYIELLRMLVAYETPSK